MLGAVTHLGGVKEHLIVHLDLPQEPRDLGVGHGHEHHVVHSEKRHQHQRGLEQLPEGRDLGAVPRACPQPLQCPGWSWEQEELRTPEPGFNPEELPEELPAIVLPPFLTPPALPAPPSQALGAILAEQAAHEALELPALACTAAGGPACPWWSPRAWRPAPGRC